MGKNRWWIKNVLSRSESGKRWRVPRNCDTEIKLLSLIPSSCISNCTSLKNTCPERHIFMQTPRPLEMRGPFWFLPPPNKFHLKPQNTGDSDASGANMKLGAQLPKYHIYLNLARSWKPIWGHLDSNVIKDSSNQLLKQAAFKCMGSESRGSGRKSSWRKGSFLVMGYTSKISGISVCQFFFLLLSKHPGILASNSVNNKGTGQIQDIQTFCEASDPVWLKERMTNSMPRTGPEI